MADLATAVTVLDANGRAGVPSLLISGPGMGKSSLVRGLAAADGVLCKTVLGSLRDDAFRLLARLRDAFSTIRVVWADGGCPGRLVGWANQVVALQIQIIKRIPCSTGFHVRPRVWVVERTFAWINKHRRCVRDYETRPDHQEAMVHIAMISLMTRRLARTS